MTEERKDREGRTEASDLLSAEERVVLGKIASEVSPHGRRAQALVALDAGASQAEAGEQAGLTRGQVRYWRAKFLGDRLGIFPEELLERGGPASPDSPDGFVAEPAQEEAGADGVADTPEPAESAQAAVVDEPKAKKKSAKKASKREKTAKSRAPKGKKKTRKSKKRGKKKKKEAPKTKRGKKRKKGKKK